MDCDDALHSWNMGLGWSGAWGLFGLLNNKVMINLPSCWSEEEQGQQIEENPTDW
jgi:hypothetical protein